MADNSVLDGISTTFIIIILFLVIASYNVLELTFSIFSTFRSRNTLYFYSFLVATWGTFIYAAGYLIKDARLSSSYVLNCTLIMVGWIGMITGQSVVLYSRLHLIVRNPETLRRVLIMIVFNACLCHPPIIVLIFGANSPTPARFVLPYSIAEKIQVTVFFIQELIISILYIVHAIPVLRPEGDIRGKKKRRAMAHLVYVNAAIVLLDITILTLEYSGLYDIQTAYKAFVYSVKLKLEFSILNRLVDLAGAGKRGGWGHRGRLEMLEGMGEGREKGYSTFVYSGRERETGGGENREVTVVTVTEIVVESDATSVSESGVINGKEISGDLERTSLSEEKDFGVKGTGASAGVWWV